MRVGSGVILFQLAGFLTSALADFYFAKHILSAEIKNKSSRSRLAPIIPVAHLIDFFLNS